MKTFKNKPSNELLIRGDFKKGFYELTGEYNKENRLISKYKYVGQVIVNKDIDDIIVYLEKVPDNTIVIQK